MLRENTTTSTRESTAAFDSIIQDSGSFPEYYKMDAGDYLRHIMGKTAMYADVVATSVAEPELVDARFVETTERQTTIETTADAETGDVEPDGRGRVRRVLGRIATAPLRAVSWVNQMHYSLVATAIGKMPGKLTKDELLVRDQARQEKFAVHEDDGFMTRSRKLLGRNAVRASAWLPTVAMGALGASSIFRPLVGEVHEMVPTVELPYTNAVATTLIPIDGLGGKDGTAWGSFMQETNQADGATIVKPVQYPAEIFPVGMTTMKDSAVVGSADAYGKYGTSKGGPVTIGAYSEGNDSALETVNKIKADNGGELPSNVHVKEYGNPYTRAGVFHNSIAKTIDPLLKGVGIVSDLQSPKGADNYYWENDFWANSGNQSGPTQVRLLGELATGGHKPYDPTEAVRTINFVDADGVKDHVGQMQYSPLVQKAIEMFHIPDPEGLNNALNKIAPIGINPDVQVQPDYDGGSVALSESVQKNFGIYIAPDMVNNIAHMLGNLPQQVSGTTPDQVTPIGDPSTIPSNAVISGPGVMPPTDLPPAPAPEPAPLPDVLPAPVDQPVVPGPVPADVPVLTDAPAPDAP